MTAKSSTTTITPNTAPAQSAVAFDAVDAQLQLAGFVVFFSLAPGAANSRAKLYRCPTLDPYHCRADYLLMHNANGGASLFLENVFDYNILFGGPVIGIFSASSGEFSGGTWPSTGIPAITTTTGGSNSSVDFDGLSTYTLRVIASEYGVVVALNTGGTGRIAMLDRHMDSTRSKREMKLLGLASSAYPLTFAAPSGGIATHLRVRIEGVNFNITFPTAIALNAFRIAQEITRQMGGFGEAYVRPRLVGNDEIVVRIPPDRAPSANYSETRPQIALLYQDPETFTAGLRFNLGPSGAAEWTVGANSIQRSSFNFPFTVPGPNVRIGATVRNHTQNLSTTITRFSTTTTQDDTAHCVSTAGWLTTDVIEVYPGPEDHMHGYGRHGGHFQAVLEGAETSNITDGADRVVILNDRYGEAQDKYEVGQQVILANNGMAVVLTLTPISGVFLPHETVTVTAGTGTGAQGIIRGIDGATIAVDSTLGPVAGTTLWSTGATITGVTSMATATITVPLADNANTGWSGFAVILAIGQVNPAGGDYRTKLTLDLDRPGTNTGFQVGPGAVIGIRAKSFSLVDIGSSLAATPVPGIGGLSPADSDVNRHEIVLFTEPMHEPDWETHSLTLAEIGLRQQDISAIGGDQTGPLAHVRAVNARGTVPSFGDQMPEDFDPNRHWVPVINNTGPYGAMMSTGAQWIVIGPGAIP